ncbi:MAG: hypothetical protein ABIJ00_11505 [Candidatus Eisenbacteria bacterium]
MTQSLKGFKVPMLMLVFGLAFALGVQDAGAAPADSVGPAFHIGANPVYGSPMANQFNPAVASDGTDYLVVWDDQRNTLDFDIYGARVAADGTVLDEVGIAACIAVEDQKEPAIAFDGTNYLVVWTDERNGSADIYGSRMGSDGQVLDPDGILISAASSAQSSPAVAFGDTAYFVTWTDWRDGNANIYAARVALDGTVLDTSGVMVSAAVAEQEFPAVSFDGTGWLVVWHDSRSGQADIYGSRVALDGTVLDSSGIVVSASVTEELNADITFNGTNYLVVWDDEPGATSRDVYAARVAPDGTVLDPAGIPVCTVANQQEFAAASSDGSNYLVTWIDFRGGGTWDAYGARVDAAGNVIDVASLPICTDPSQQYAVDPAFNGTNWLVAWHDSRNGPKDIYGTRVATDGSGVDPAAFPISTAAAYQSHPELAFDGGNYLAVWHEWRSATGYDIRGVRVAADGTVLDPGGIVISARTTDELDPAVSFDGTNYLVVWQDERSGSFDIYAARIDIDGNVLNPSGIALSATADQEEYPAVAFDGTNYFVSWQDNRNGIYTDIYGTRLTVTGTVLDPAGIAVSDANRNQGQPAVSFDGTNYLVVWQDARNVYNDIYGTRVTTGGTVLDGAGIPISSASLAQEYPALAFDGTNYVVAWQDKRASSNYNIYLSRVGTDGTVLDPAGILASGAAGDQIYPAIAFDQRNYLVVWQDGRSSAGYDIYGTDVDPDGSVLDPSGIAVSTADHDQAVPAVCSSSYGLVLTAYASLTAPPDYGIHRIWANFYDVRAGITHEDDGRECARLLDGFPNPSRGPVTLRFSLSERQRVSLRVYDVEGRLVETLLDGFCEAGARDIGWDGGSPCGRPVAPGLYFCRLQTGVSLQTIKIMRLR